MKNNNKAVVGEVDSKTVCENISVSKNILSVENIKNKRTLSAIKPKTKPESSIMGAFVFESYYKAMLRIKSFQKRWALFEAIFKYSCYGVAPENLDNEVSMCFELIAPVIDKSRGRKRGNPHFEDGRPNPYYVNSDEKGGGYEKCNNKNISNAKMCFSDSYKNLDENLEYTQIDKLIDSKTEDKNVVDNDVLQKKSQNTKTLKSFTAKAKDNSKKSMNYVDNSHMIKNKDKVKDKDSNIYVGESSFQNDESFGFANKNNTRDGNTPTLDEIRRYIKRRGYDVDPEYFFNYYESRNWQSGKAKITNWKNCICLWQSNDELYKIEKKIGIDKFASKFDRKAIGFKNIENDLDSINFDV